MENHKEEQELIFKLSLFEQQIRNLQEQLQAVEQVIEDSIILKDGLENLKGAKDKEVMASIGRGIFTMAKLASEELIVDIGGKNFVVKNIQETQEMIDQQKNKLEEIKKDLENKLKELNNELTNFFSGFQGKKK